jgi:hypothetical protein
MTPRSLVDGRGTHSFVLPRLELGSAGSSETLVMRLISVTTRKTVIKMFVAMKTSMLYYSHIAQCASTLQKGCILENMSVDVLIWECSDDSDSIS